MEAIIYDIITYLILGAAFFIAVRKFIQKAFAKKEADSCSNGCGGCTSKCDLKELVNTNNTTW